MRFAVLLLLVATPLFAQKPYPRISSNDNRTSAGVLKDGVLTIKLDIVRGMWYPDRDSDPGVDVLAFAEAGHAPQVPGPLIRVPAGTEIRATVRNASDSSLIIFGLSGSRALADTVRIKPGETRELVSRVGAPGTFMYRAITHTRAKNEDPRQGDDMMLAGALVADEPGTRVADRIMVLLQWLDSTRVKGSQNTSDEVLTINGKGWPFNERLSYNLGDTIRWRVINASFDVHPMHLHGAYFTVLSRGLVNTDTLYTPQQQRFTVTERMKQLSTMYMSWVPPHAGNWAFHCHLTFHIVAHGPLGNMKASADEHMDHGMRMGGLAIGTTVHGPVAADSRATRHMRLVVEQYDSIPGELVPRYSYELDGARKFTVPGPPIILQRDETVAITVVNHTNDPTSVHWHGVEIQSYYDGVPGFGGDANRTTPMIAAHDSFVVNMTAPRAGTFIYHTHADEVRQQMGGLYGPFIVLDKNQRWDPTHDVPLLISDPRDTSVANAVWINGPNPQPIMMKSGETYRLRLINITLARPNIYVTLSKDGKPVSWNLIARDGADLPASQAGNMPAKIDPLTIGQTFDALFTPMELGEYQFEVRTGAGKLLRSYSIVVE